MYEVLEKCFLCESIGNPYLVQGDVTHILTVRWSVTAVKVKVKVKGVDLCLVKDQGHYFWLMVNGVLYSHNWLWRVVYTSIRHYTKLYVAYNFQVEIFSNCDYVFGVSNIVS